MEVKLDDAWKSVDAAVGYVTSWMWMFVWWLLPPIALCLVLAGLKQIVMIGPWVPEVGPPMYWALTGAFVWAVTNAKKPW